MATLRELNLDLQSQEETVVQHALTELQGHDLVNLDPRLSQNLLAHCSEKLHSANVAIRARALSVLVTLLRDGESGELGAPPSAASQRSNSRSSRGISTHTEALAKKLQSPSVLDLKVGSTGSVEDYAAYHSNLCHLITELQMRSPRKFMPGFKPIGQYLVQCTGHENRKIATSACEYWAKLKIPPVPSKMMDHWVPPVLTRLQSLVPALLNNMIYHPKQVDYLENGKRGDSPPPPDLDQYSNLRNYAALGFENLCQIFQNEITAIFKPILEKRVLGGEWLETEAVLLALSAYTQAMGVPKDMAPLYARLMPKLLEFYSHPKPLIRSIACFTLQHFINKPIKGVKDPFSKMLKYGSRLLSDACPEVQVMAVRSLASMLAFSNKDVAPFKDTLVATFQEAGEALQGEARFPLYESIGHMYGRLGAMLDAEDTKRLLQPVMRHWSALDLQAQGAAAQDSEEVMLVCQPMCIIAMYSKDSFQPYNGTVLNKVAAFLEEVCQQATGTFSQELTTMLVSVLDLTSALFEGQGPGIAAAASECHLAQHCISLLHASALDNRVHQSALAVLGHVAQHAYSSLQPSLNQFLSIIKTKLESSSSEESLKNNALWALSFIAANESSVKNEQLFALTNVLLHILKELNGDEGCVINAALALTSLCANWPETTVSLLLKADLFDHLCALLQVEFPRSGERDTIFRNLCTMLEPNLSKVPRSHWGPFCIAAASLDTQDRKLLGALTALLKNLRGQLGNKGWNLVSQQVGPQLAIVLRKRYKLY